MRLRSENQLYKWFSNNYNVKVYTYVPKDTVVYTGSDGFALHSDTNKIRWYNLQNDKTAYLLAVSHDRRTLKK